MGEEESWESRIASVTVPARVESLSPVLALVGAAAAELGFSGEDRGRLEVVLEEACTNVIDHAFEPGERGAFDVVLSRRPGKLVISIRDKGLPFDMRAAEEGRGGGLGLRIIRAFVDEVRFANLGQEGKRLDLVKHLPSRHVADALPECGSRPPAPRRTSEAPLELRLMRPEESAGLSRCVYRTYGYSYLSDFIYYPDRIRERLESGLMASCVAVAPDGEIEGHLAMTLRERDDSVAEAGQAVVAPEYRGRGLFTRMKRFLAEHARSRGILGFYSEAAASHPFSQRGNLEVGARETGILLAYAPATLEFRNLAGASTEERPSAVLFYLRTNEGGERAVFAPEHHARILSRIYGRAGLRRSFRSAGGRARNLPERSKAELGVLRAWGQGTIRILEAGADLRDKVRFALREMCRQQVACIFADLRLSDPAAAEACGQLEELGFFFGGVLPEYDSGDVLRLQYLNNITVDAGKVSTASDFGRELLDYAVRSMEA